MTSPSKTLCYLAIGSNLDHPREQISRALQTISNHPAITLLKQSPWYGSKAIGPGKQPDYLNGVIEIETSLSPEQLLQALQKIETDQGRTRDVRWGARTLDIDILLYGQEQLHSDTLVIPHPGVSEREFVLYPLHEIADPGLEIPGRGRLADLVAGCPRRGLEVLSGE